MPPQRTTEEGSKTHGVVSCRRHGLHHSVGRAAWPEIDLFSRVVVSIAPSWAASAPLEEGDVMASTEQ